MLKSRYRRLYRFEVLDMMILVNSVIAACVLHNICLSEQDLCDMEEPPPDDNMDADNGIFVRDGHEVPGVQMRNQLMLQLVNIQ